ncbi:hypothetical protein O181_060069 [Austropuccinia psidii MF-1]|uniref:Integrase catalytic domain-containing protein n=1 Tax=Austropuccinia psidii MF-1 TaxID=1389203 RepID=A0A9Q3EFL0_9BASI|nr:hypothetical protein [Austropuccinia psidii MF-1]
MNQLLTILNGATIFSKIDLHGAYNLLRIKEGDEHLAAFRTKYGSYEYLIMPFGLTNSPAAFQNLVNDIFPDFLYIFVVVYLDGIMVFSSSEEEHVKHVASVLQRLRDNDLFSKASKCVFHASSLEYFGYVVSNSPFVLNEEPLSHFQILKEASTTSPILSHFNPSLPTIVETDASDYALGAVLSQVYDSGKHPISFDCRKLLPAETNHYIHDKEPLGIVWALKCWRAFHLSLPNSSEVLKDHYSLQYFMCSKIITCHGIQESRFFPIKVEIFSDLVDQSQKEVWKDKDYYKILKKLARGESVSDYSLEPQAKLLLFKDIVLVPRNEQIQLNILQKCHDSPLAGHPGQERTLKLIKRYFSWAGINQFIKDYVSSCQQCSRNKNIHHKNFGLLKPLQIPSGPWNSLSMDSITQFPLSSNFDLVLVVVDRFSKMAIFIPAYGTITSLDSAQIVINNVFSKHGLPASIVSDRGSLFFSSFWTQLCQNLKISIDLSTAFHPKTDGQTQKVNQTLEQYLWITFINKAITFFTNYGRNPSFDSIHISQDSPAGMLSTKLQSVQQVVKEELESAIRRLKKYADGNRTIPPDFQPGDKVWLASKNIKTARPTKKLSERWLGAFEFLKKIGSHAYHLKLPQQWKSVHPVFHVSLLEPVKKSTISNQHQLPPPPVIVEEQEECEVAQVLDLKLKSGKLWYLVEWKGFSEDLERTTREQASNPTN